MSRPNSQPRYAPTLRAAFILLTMGVVFGCQLVFGDYELNIDEGKGGGGSTAKGTGGAGACADGQARCTDTGELQECQDGKWNMTSTCGDLDHCSDVAKACVECGSGQTRCSSDGTKLELCNPDRTGWRTIQDCAPNRCFSDATGSVCVECEPFGSTECEEGGDAGDRLRVCGGNGKLSFQTCDGPDKQCITVPDGNDYCSKCTTNGFTCTSAGVLKACTNHLESDIQDCGAPEKCNAAGPGCLL